MSMRTERRSTLIGIMQAILRTERIYLMWASLYMNLVGLVPFY